MTEAKLDKIYECLDNGNYKLGIRLCLKPDISSLPITRSLLSYCYAMTRDRNEALKIARGVMLLVPTDEGVLNTLSYTFKACGAHADLSQCYENALKIQPNNTVFVSELFYCYLRMNEIKKMQLLSQKLYKITGQSIYVFWSVSCMIQQSDLPPAMLAVAEKMIYKVLCEGNCD